MNRRNQTGKVSFGRMRSFIFFGLIIVLGIGVLYTLRPFFYPLFWAAVLAVMFYPMYRWIHKHLRSESLSSFISILLIIIILILPVFVLAMLLLQESISLYQQAVGSELFQNPEHVIGQLEGTVLEPYAASLNEQWAHYSTNIAELSSVAIGYMISSISQITKSLGYVAKFLFMAFIMFYSLFYFLKDGVRMLKRVMHLSPLGDQYEAMLYERFTSTTKATLKGTVIIGGIQGLIGGILFWVAGIQGAFVWGFIMIILGIIPAIGPSLVLFGAGLIALITGNIFGGVVLLVGGGVVSVIDNLLRGPIVGKDTQMHPVVVLLTTLGGIILFGISGFVIGPILAALFISVVSIYDFYYRNELQNN